MSEVVDWSPVDDDNDAAPPVGAPEGMMPSAVNNTLRAMMASLRRMYDKLVDGTQALPYLPTAGGVVSGNVAVNGTGGVALGPTQLRNISGGLEVYNAAGGAIVSRGPDNGVYWGDQNQVAPGYGWYSSAGLAYLWNEATGNVLSVTNAGRMALAGAIDTPQHLIQGTLFAQRSSNAHVIYDGGGEISLALYGPASGNINYYQAEQHVFQTNAGAPILTLIPGTVTFPGNLTAVLTITGQQLTSTGNIDALSGTVTAAAITGNVVTGNAVNSNGNMTAAGTVTGTVVNSNSSLGVAGNAEVAGTIAAGGTIFATGFVDTNGLFSVVDELKALMARVAALETQASGGS